MPQVWNYDWPTDRLARVKSRDASASKNRTDCDGKNWPKTSQSHRCYKKKNIGIASLSKIDHRSSLIVFKDIKYIFICSGSMLKVVVWLILRKGRGNQTECCVGNEETFPGTNLVLLMLMSDKENYKELLFIKCFTKT